MYKFKSWHLEFVGGARRSCIESLKITATPHPRWPVERGIWWAAYPSGLTEISSVGSRDSRSHDLVIARISIFSDTISWEIRSARLFSERAFTSPIERNFLRVVISLLLGLLCSHDEVSSERAIPRSRKWPQTWDGTLHLQVSEYRRARIWSRDDMQSWIKSN